MIREDTQEQNDSLIIESLLDGATSNYPLLSPETKPLQELAADLSQPLEDRLEAFEDIMESEVGDTTLLRARNVEREIGFRQLYLKFEGGNPTGTQKDRIAFAQVGDAMRRGFDTVTAASCGNFGVALALASSFAGLRCQIYIPERYHTRRIIEMEKLGAEIIRVPGGYEDAVMISRRHAEEKELYDGNPGGANTALQLKAYGGIAYEIYDELRDAPAAVAVPVSNGTTLAGISKGFASLRRRGKTSRMPRIIGGSSFRKNPVVAAFLKKAASCDNLVPEKIRETPVNEPLVNWHSIDGDHALEALRSSDGWAANASDKSMLAYSRLIRQHEGMSVLPASTAGLIAIADFHKRENLPDDRYVVVLTGRKQ